MLVESEEFYFNVTTASGKGVTCNERYNTTSFVNLFDITILYNGITESSGLTTDAGNRITFI